MAGGNDKFNKNLKNAAKHMIEGAVRGLRLGAAIVKRESQSRTPVDEGNLKGGHYTAVQVNKSFAVAEIGTVADYAIYVHEDLDAHHPVGEAKFLDNAIQAKKDEVLKLIHRNAKL